MVQKMFFHNHNSEWRNKGYEILKYLTWSNQEDWEGLPEEMTTEMM